VERNGSDGTRTRDLRRDRPIRAETRSYSPPETGQDKELSLQDTTSGNTVQQPVADTDACTGLGIAAFAAT
jgi:hypothetical protein